MCWVGCGAGMSAVVVARMWVLEAAYEGEALVVGWWRMCCGSWNISSSCGGWNVCMVCGLRWLEMFVVLEAVTLESDCGYGWSNTFGLVVVMKLMSAVMVTRMLVVEMADMSAWV